MKPKKLIILNILLTIIFFFSVSVLQAQQLKLKNLVLDNVGGKIQLRFGVGVENIDELSRHLRDSITLRLTCEAKIIRKVTMWWDKVLSKNNIVFKITNNPLTHTYTLQDVSHDRTMQNKDLQALLHSNWGKLIMDLGNWGALPWKHDYALELKVSLKRADAPAWLKTILFFWSWDVISSKNYRMDFVY